MHYCDILTMFVGWKQCGNVQVARTKDRMRYFKRACVTAKSAIAMLCIIVLSSCNVEHLD